MRLRLVLIVLALAVPLAFVAGRLSRPRTQGGGVKEGRTVLYYVDPMNPSFRSSEPGVAPCGMALEPVFADGAGTGGQASSEGAIEVRPDRQQLVGVTFETVSEGKVPYSLRLLGTVAVDETRRYEIGSITQGWVREVSAATSGTFVRKGEILAKYYSQEAYNPQQAFIYALNAIDRNAESSRLAPDQKLPFEHTVLNSRQSLLNVGMSAQQIDSIASRREIDPLVEIRAPASGFILTRNVSLGQAFEPTTTLYTMADLSRVWILADAFETDEKFLGSGSVASVSHPALGRDIPATVSAVLPEFDPITRTLKVRLEAANPGYGLRPGMFVDVTVPVELGPALTVAREAVLDSGSHQQVFVELGEGRFEPRAVKTGWRYAGRVEILEGLSAGERVASSGNFLLDSESRMRVSATTPEEPAVDPVCGMKVDRAQAQARGLTSTIGGRTFYFCSPGCKEKLEHDPEAYPRPTS